MFFVYVPAKNDFSGDEAELIGPFSSPDGAVIWASARMLPGTWHDVELTGVGKWDALHGL